MGAMFNHSATLPLLVNAQSSQLIPVTFTPDDLVGIKTATLEITHDGANSPISVELTADLFDPNTTLGVNSFTLVNAGSDTDFFELTDGMQVDNNIIQGINLNIRANTNPNPVGSVALSLSGPVNSNRTESTAPYALFGDVAGNYAGQQLPLGSYTMSATAYSGAGLSGSVVGSPYIIQFTVVDIAVNQPPSAIASANPLSGEFPLDVSFTGSTSTDDVAIASYLWDFDDGNTSNSADLSHTFLLAGVYNVTLTVTDDEGLTDVANLTINVIDPAVNQPPVAVASASPTIGLAPLNVSFTGSNSTDDEAVVSYLWDFGDGNGSSQADPTHNYINPGNYTATLTVTDAEALQGQTTIDITVNDPSAQGVVGFTLINSATDLDFFELTDGMEVDNNIIQGINLNIRANTNPNPVGSVALSLSGPVNSNRTESTAPYALFGDVAGNYAGQQLPLGSYTMSATAYSGAGLSGSVVGSPYIIQFTVVDIAVNQPPSAIASANPLSGEFPLDVSFTGSTSTDDVAIASYLWDFDDGNTSNSADLSHTFLLAGVYNVTLTVTDDEGLTDVANLTINVIDPAVNQPPVAVASASPTIGLAPLNVSFTGSNSTDDEAVVSYLWDFGDGNGSSQADPTHNYINPGNYTATLTVTDAEALQGQTTIDITVNDPSAQGVVGFTLINSATDLDFFELTDGMEVDNNIIQGINLNIRANTNPDPVGSVALSLSGPVNNNRTESVAPYALFGDTAGNYAGQQLPLGTYTLSGTAYSGPGLSGSVVGGVYSIQFTITDNPGSSARQGSDSEIAGVEIDGGNGELALTNEDYRTGYSFEIHPNPASNMAYISFSHSTDSLREVYLHSMDGRLIRHFSAGQHNLNELPVYDLDNGLYIITCISETGQKVQEKLVVKN